VTPLSGQPDLVACLTTGSTPLPIYDPLPGALARRGTLIEAATIVLLDEYLGLPAGHPVRCDGQLRHQLIDRLEAPPARFVAFDGDAGDPATACARSARRSRPWVVSTS